jgi:hypothetical protein
LEREEDLVSRHWRPKVYSLHKLVKTFAFKGCDVIRGLYINDIKYKIKLLLCGGLLLGSNKVEPSSVYSLSPISRECESV